MQDNLNSIVNMFRNAIITAKENFRFSCKDRMHRFPHGCCDDASDLLGYYLLHKYDIRTIQITGTYRDGIPENTINHACLKAEDETDIDITVDQFISMTNKPGFISANDNFYSLFKDQKRHDNYDIHSCERLWNDYQIINQYLGIYADTDLETQQTLSDAVD